MALKYSRQRESIKANLMNRQDHPTADMVYDDIRKMYPHISLGTVYRNLSLLVSLGEVTRIAMLSGADRFDGNTEPHSHFICKKCGQIFDLPHEIPDEVMEAVQATTEHRIEECSLTFYGTCSECVSKES